MVFAKKIEKVSSLESYLGKILCIDIKSTHECKQKFSKLQFFNQKYIKKPQKAIL